jgi:polysaccharide biosynthesis protein PslH
MNILFLTQVLSYPLDAGPKIRAYYVLRHLADSGHQVSLLSFSRESDQPDYVDHLRQYCRDVQTIPMPRSRVKDARALLNSLVNGQPFLIVRDWSPSMAQAAKQLAQHNPPFDAIHADQLWMAPYAMAARAQSAKSKTPFAVLDQHNAVFQIPQRIAETRRSFGLRTLLQLEAKKLARYEADLCARFDHVVWVTDDDRRALFDKSAGRATGTQTVIPIALDTAGIPDSRKQPARRITFLGGQHWPPNADGIRWFIERMWMEIRTQAPGLTLTIIGKNPPAMQKAFSDPSIEMTGYVADPSPYLSQTSVFIVPLLAGGGMRVKILDAWSHRLPVVSTRIGAEGIRACHGENILLADEPADFASAVLRVVNNPGLADRLSLGGVQTLKSFYDWRKAYCAWDSIYPCASYTSSLMPPA